MVVPDVFPYSCEKCSNLVVLTLAEYNKLKNNKYGSRIVCETCEPKEVMPYE